jgi:hypothetical protein
VSLGDNISYKFSSLFYSTVTRCTKTVNQLTSTSNFSSTFFTHSHISRNLRHSYFQSIHNCF